MSLLNNEHHSGLVLDCDECLCRQNQSLILDLNTREKLLQACQDQLSAGEEKQEDLHDQIDKLKCDKDALEADITASREETMEARRNIEVSSLSNVLLYK